MNEMASCATRWSIAGKSHLAVVEFVERALQLSKPKSSDIDRRGDKRAAFPHLLTLTPIADDEIRPTGDPVTVVGKYLAERGLDFYHCDAIPFKRTIVSFDSNLQLDTQLVLSIAWCRFLRPGWYDSGGRFTHIVTPDSNEWFELP
jgi:hypothetical protein